MKKGETLFTFKIVVVAVRPSMADGLAQRILRQNRRYSVGRNRLVTRPAGLSPRLLAGGGGNPIPIGLPRAVGEEAIIGRYQLRRLVLPGQALYHALAPDGAHVGAPLGV